MEIIIGATRDGNRLFKRKTVIRGGIKLSRTYVEFVNGKH